MPRALAALALAGAALASGCVETTHEAKGSGAPFFGSDWRHVATLDPEPVPYRELRPVEARLGRTSQPSDARLRGDMTVGVGAVLVRQVDGAEIAATEQAAIRVAPGRHEIVVAVLYDGCKEDDPLRFTADLEPARSYAIAPLRRRLVASRPTWTLTLWEAPLAVAE